MKLDPPDPSANTTPKEITEKDFRLSWKDYEANLSKSLAGIRDQSQFFDCMLATDYDDGASLGYLRAHKVILAACSEFFRNILTEDLMAVHPNPLIYIGGVSTKDMKSILDFMYHGEVNVAQDDLMRFLKVAESHKIKGLMDGPNVSPVTKRTTSSKRDCRSKKRSMSLLSCNDSNKKPKIKPLEDEEIEDDRVVKCEDVYSGSDGTDTFEKKSHTDYGPTDEDEEGVDDPYGSSNEEEISDNAVRSDDLEDDLVAIPNASGGDESVPGTNPSNKFYKGGYVGTGSKLKWIEKREKIANRLKEGMKPREIMRELECSDRLVYRVKRMLKDKENLSAWW